MINLRFSRPLIRWWWVAVTTAALLVLVLGPWGFWIEMSIPTEKSSEPSDQRESPTAWGVFYRTLQLFTLSEKYLSGKITKLEIARFLGAFVFFSTLALTFMEIFHDRLRYLGLSVLRGHVVVCGLGSTTAGLIKTLVQQGKRVVILENNAHHENLPLCRNLGALVLIGHSREEWLLRRARLSHAQSLLCLSDDEFDNVRTALLARRLAVGRKLPPLHCVVHVKDRDLRNSLIQQDLLDRSADPFRLELFNQNEVCAQAMLQKVSCRSVGAGPNRILLVGLGELGEALLVRLARNWLLDEKSSTRHQILILVEQDAEQQQEHLASHYPFLEEVCDLQFHSVDIMSTAFASGEFVSRDGPSWPLDVAFVCIADETRSLVGALRLSEFMARQAVPIILGVANASGLDSLLQGKLAREIHVVGMREVLADPSLVLAATREALAQAIHEHYVHTELARGVTSTGSPSLVSWQDLREDLKRSNRAQAAHIITKLQAVGCRLVPIEEKLNVFVFNLEEVERLARMEHERWCEERRRSGWRFGSDKNMERRRHPSLVPWGQVNELDQDRDRAAVQYIPTLAAKAGYAIIRDGA